MVAVDNTGEKLTDELEERWPVSQGIRSIPEIRDGVIDRQIEIGIICGPVLGCPANPNGHSLSIDLCHLADTQRSNGCFTYPLRPCKKFEAATDQIMADPSQVPGNRRPYETPTGAGSMVEAHQGGVPCTL